MLAKSLQLDEGSLCMASVGAAGSLIASILHGLLLGGSDHTGVIVARGDYCQRSLGLCWMWAPCCSRIEQLLSSLVLILYLQPS